VDDHRDEQRNADLPNDSPASVETVRGHTQTEKILTGERDFLASVLEAADAFILILDDQGRILRVNRAVEEATGYSGEALEGRDFLETLPISEAWGALAEGIRRLRTGATVSAFESHWVKSNGERLLVSGSLTALRDSRRHLEHVVITASDVTQRREVEGELRAASLHDDLTGLYNRRGFVLLAEQRLMENRRSGAPLALVFADIDDMKAINDAFGHGAGDIGLALAARALKVSFREADIVARIGGDEFAIIADLESHDMEVLSVRLKKEIARLVAVSGLRFNMSLALGVTYSQSPHTVLLEEMLRRADSFMYEQKHRSTRDRKPEVPPAA
jgi:diguanylate cyclase (GGDEF)-like protein/PAS domain S-box-containing protein